MSETNTHTRRSILTMAPAAGLSALMAGAVPASSIHSDWMDQIMDHVHQIVALLNSNAPEDTSLQGFEFRCNSEGLIQESIWATAIPDHCRWLAHARPGIASGWRANGALIGGAA